MLRLPILTKRLRLRNIRTLVDARNAQTSPNALSSTHTSTNKSPPVKYREGDVIHGFKVDQVTSVEDYFLTSVKLTHNQTGAQYLHLERDDSNNVFSVAFRTTPTDSTGLPHILEHTTTCGSDKYPCKDVFMKMVRRSLATFMNAMTGPDYTMYPFSTQNIKDFQNLQSVYMDFVFRPKLRELDFRQEGWRLEHENVNDKKTDVIFKGVVFNEMKGVFNENQYIFMEALLNTLLPSNTYSYISGGDPLVIPNLTHKNLVDFHRKYYHPSNARFYSYGNFSLEEHLKFVNDGYLSDSERIDADATRVPPEARWTSPRKRHITCRRDPLAADGERQSSIAISYLCNDIADVDTSFDLYVLSQLLLKGPNTAFYKSLIDSNIGSGFASVTGYDSSCKDTMFVVGLQGVRAEDFGKVERVFDETLAKVMEEGFRKEHIEAVLHSMELHNKHQSSNFGLHLLFNLTPLWNHDGDVVKSLRINDAIARFREQLRQKPEYLQDLVREYLARNQHRLTLTMSPDEKYEEKLAMEEAQLLKEKLAQLSEEELDGVYEQGQALLAEQTKNPNLELLPTLRIEDLKDDVERYKLDQTNVAGVPLQTTVQPTNGLCYYRSVLSTKHLPEELKALLPLFNDVVTKMGTENYDYRQFDELVQLKTGGLRFSNHVAQHKDSALAYEEGILLTSYCLDNNARDMYGLWEELFNRVKLADAGRFETLVKIAAADLLNGIAHSGHLYAMSSAAGLVSPAAKLKESLSGLEFVARMKNLAQSKDFGPVLADMRRIADGVLSKGHMRSSLNVSSEDSEAIKHLGQLNEALKGTPRTGKVMTSVDALETTKARAIQYVLPYAVNYASKSLLTVPYTHPEHAALTVLAKLITSVYLHPEIREKGGAYGGGAKMSTEGIFTFYSYRDPHSTKTLDTFERTFEFLEGFDFPEADITEAKLGIFQQFDAPVSPDSRGVANFMYGLTYDEIQQQRLRIKAVDREQLMGVAEKFLKPRQDGVVVGRALIGPKNADLKERLSENWTVVDTDESGSQR